MTNYDVKEIANSVNDIIDTSDVIMRSSEEIAAIALLGNAMIDSIVADFKDINLPGENEYDPSEIKNINWCTNRVIRKIKALYAICNAVTYTSNDLKDASIAIDTSARYANDILER